jgi:hypothetical protein
VCEVGEAISLPGLDERALRLPLNIPAGQILDWLNAEGG